MEPNAWLTRRLIDFEETPVQLSEIDLGEHQLLQNREEYEIPEWILEDYTAGWLRDDPFPPVILWQQPDKAARPYMPVDGYTRCTSALRAGREQIDALVIDVDEVTAQQLAFEANADHGRQSSREFRLYSTSTLIDQGMSIREAAARLKLPERLVADSRKNVEIRRRCQKLKIAGMDEVPDSSLAKLSGIGLDAPFRALAELIRDANLKAGKVADLVTAVRKGHSEDDQLAIVEGARAELIAARPDDTITKQLATWNRFKKRVIELEAFDVDEMLRNAAQAGVGKDDVHEIVVRLKEMTVLVEAVADEVFV